jgi:drug/metabolite transporter (DMT)-like permease
MLKPMSKSILKPMVIGFACAIITIMLWSGNFIVALSLSEEIAPLALAFWRWVVAITAFCL